MSTRAVLAAMALVSFGSIALAQTRYDSRQNQYAVTGAANAPIPAQEVPGGNWLFYQSCSGYGTVTLQTSLDGGSTWAVSLTRTSADATPTAFQLGSFTWVRTTNVGTTACFEKLSRVPYSG